MNDLNNKENNYNAIFLEMGGFLFYLKDKMIINKFKL
jgi:hypothetical protein